MTPHHPIRREETMSERHDTREAIDADLVAAAWRVANTAPDGLMYSQYLAIAMAAADAIKAAKDEGWQPIETAPRAPLSEFLEEGPTILLYGGFSDGNARTGHWKAKKTNAWCDTAVGRMPKAPTHWRPLPSPPHVGTKAGERT